MPNNNNMTDMTSTIMHQLLIFKATLYTEDHKQGWLSYQTDLFTVLVDSFSEGDKERRAFAKFRFAADNPAIIFKKCNLSDLYVWYM